MEEFVHWHKKTKHFGIRKGLAGKVGLAWILKAKSTFHGGQGEPDLIIYTYINESSS